MPLLQLYGHEQIRNRFASAIGRGALPGSLLLHGPGGVGKQRLALWVGQLLLCTAGEPQPCGRCGSCRFTQELTHPDLHWFFPRPRLKDADPSPRDVEQDYAEAIAERVARHGLYARSGGLEGIFIAAVRAIVQSAAISPAMAKRKVYVVGDAERMVPQIGSDQAANAFLKLLEEPPADTTIILTSSEPGALLPTIRSRVVAVRVPLLSDAAVREMVTNSTAANALREQGVEGSVDEIVQSAAGAPGRLLSQDSWAEAMRQARRLIDAATGTDRAARYQAALGQGATKARGAFSDTLDAITALLHERVRVASLRHDEAAAVGAARGILVVERAKEQASGNLNPQLVSASLLQQLSGLLQ